MEMKFISMRIIFARYLYKNDRSMQTFDTWSIRDQYIIHILTCVKIYSNYDNYV